MVKKAQINSYFALIEYCFTFKKPLDEESYNQFVYDNIRNLTSKDYIIWHRISKEEGKRKDDMDYWLAEQMTEESFPLICQHYITSFLYSEQGKNNPLINMVISQITVCLRETIVFHSLTYVSISQPIEMSFFIVSSDIEN